MTDRHDRQAASASPGLDEPAAFALPTRSDLVLGGSRLVSSAVPSTLFLGAGIDDLDTVGGSPGTVAYLRCGECGATIALTQRVRHDGRLIDYALDRHESCGEPAPFGGRAAGV